MSIKKSIPAIILVVALALLIGWRFQTKKAQAANLGQTKGGKGGRAASVVVAVAGPRVLNVAIQAVGSLESPFNVKISPRVTGLIDSVSVREGDVVKVGQVLAHIDPSDLVGAVYSGQANVAQAQSKYDQALITQDPTRVGVSAAIRQQKAAVVTATANLNQAKQNYVAQVAAAQSNVVDSTAKVAAAQSALANSKASLGSAQATLADAQAKYTRTYELYKQGYIAAQDVDDAKAALNVASANVAVAQGQVASATSAVTSANAQLDAQKKQAAIVANTGKASITASQAALSQAKASLNVAQANTAQNPAYQDNLNALKASVGAADGQLRQSQAKLSQTDLTSPIDGFVTERDLDPGVVANAGQTILGIQYLKWLYLRAAAPIDQSSKVFQGQKALLTLDSFPGETFTGTLSNVSPAADPTTRQFTVLIKVLNPTGKLRPGMFGHVTIVVDHLQAAVAVPREAVTSDDRGHSTVTVVDSSGTAHIQPVELGISDSWGYQILSGIKPGDQVVTLAYATVADGSKVVVGGAVSKVQAAAPPRLP